MRLTYVLNSFGNNGGQVTPAQVDKQRKVAPQQAMVMVSNVRSDICCDTVLS